MANTNIKIAEIDRSINLSMHVMRKQLVAIRKKLIGKEELSQAEIRLPAACAASLATLRGVLHRMGATDEFHSVNLDSMRMARDELDEAARSRFAAVEANDA